MMKRLFLRLVWLFLAQGAFADGKLYWRDSVPPEIPFQRALILFDKPRQTLLLQSRVGNAAEFAGETLGWVIPCPAVPELGVLAADQAELLFGLLGAISRPRIMHAPGLIFFFLSLAILFFGFVEFIFCIRFHQWARLRRLGLLAATGAVLAILMVGFLGRSIRATFEGITVIRAEDVGVYHVRVIRAATGEALVQWLYENNLHFDESDRPVLDAYVEEGWCFVVGAVRPEEESGLNFGPDGLLDAIILRFETLTPIYPLKLTATVGSDTEVLIYVLSNRKMLADARFSLEYAAPLDAGSWAAFVPGGEGVFLRWEKDLDFLCRFKGTLSSADMQSDLSFREAADNALVIPRVYRWR